MKDLVVLVADKDMKFAITGILNRPGALGIRIIEFEVIPEPNHDPGVYKECHNFLRTFQNKFRFGIVMFDKSGCGKESYSTDSIIEEVQKNLDDSGWRDRSKVIVIEPELEAWVWSDSPEVGRCLGWDSQELKNWLVSENYIMPGEIKPENPKDVFEKALATKKIPKSSSIFLNLARSVGFGRCNDKSFLRLKETLQKWFPEES
ncbi:MAG: hypothetical protein J7M18_03640 [Candidatus Eremiobacteraeota bacterium]|nr:hypothetical protein [Candidatus Eremiobacteraeota bacterium]